MIDEGNSMSERDPLLDTSESEGKRERLAKGLGSRNFHRLVITLIALDALCVLIDISWQLLDDKCPPDGNGRPETEDPDFLETLRTISLVITTLFLVEIPLVLYAFGFRYYFRAPRWGLHLMDAAVVILTFVLEMTLRGAASEVAALLILARLWRILKLVEGAALEMGEWDEEAAARASTLKRIARLLDLDPDKTKPETIYRECESLKRRSTGVREL